jgi:DNA-binding transcriptional ArsR family regulator
VRELSRHLVVVFDEFQRLNSCPGHPLAVIRDALSGVDAGHVAMLFTGSIREALEMLLGRSDEPLFQQAVPMSLPPIDRAAFEEFLELGFASTGRPATPDAIEFLLNSTGGHPRRTQQLAWQAWELAVSAGPIDAPAIETALGSAVAMSGVGDELATLIAEDGNLARVLSIVAERPGSEITRDQLHRHGLRHWSTATRALERLRLRGLVERRDDGWHACDPFVAEWVRVNSPFGEG